jgi:hypothetical protein
MPRELSQQFARRVFIPFKGAVVHRFQLSQLRVPDARYIAMYFLHGRSFSRRNADFLSNPFLSGKLLSPSFQTKKQPN